VTRATRDYPFNFGYHVMVMVIGTSTSLEYVIRAAYETMIGRLSELAAPRRLSEEDKPLRGAGSAGLRRFHPRPALLQYNFAAKLSDLWRNFFRA
jgi:hypothetical protein